MVILLDKGSAASSYLADPYALMGIGSDMRGHYFDRWVNYLNATEKSLAPWKALWIKDLDNGTFARWDKYVKSHKKNPLDVLHTGP